MATRTWKLGAQGNYLDPTNWLDGAPGAGDTTIISGAGSKPLFYGPGNDPSHFSPDSAPPGYTISGETITFQANGGTAATPEVLGVLSNTTIASNTRINAVGSGVTDVAVWFNNTLAGTINVGDNPDGFFRLSLWSDWPKNGVAPPNDEGLPTTTNTGTINVSGDGGEFWLHPLVGGNSYSVSFVQNGVDYGYGIQDVSGTKIVRLNPFTGFADFANKGQINVAPGGEFLDRGSPLSGGFYFHSFYNDGSIAVHGAEGMKTFTLMDTNLRGNGNIIVDGGNSTSATATQFALTGPMFGGNVYLRDASMYMQDGLNFARAVGGTINFLDGHSYLYLNPSVARGPASQTIPGLDTQSLIEPFGAHISGFRAGDTIAFSYSFVYDNPFDNVRYGTQWDQASHHLSVTRTSDSSGTSTVAQFTLDGTYDAGEFQVSGGSVNTGNEVAGYINDTGDWSTFGGKPVQLDITTTHVGGPTTEPGLAPTTAGGSADGGSVPINASTVGVYRFFNTQDGTHFFTASTSERDTVMTTRSDMAYEGVGLQAIDPASGDPAAAPIYRFFDTQYGTHFFTASPAERDNVIATRPDLTFEGPGFYEHTIQQAGDTPVYRFFDTVYGTHLYTANAGERASILATRSDLTDEGIGFYAPHTG